MAASLKQYRAKRNFALTPEPKGQSKIQEDSLVFVIQKHAASHLHYDLRLEMDGVLKSWAVPKGPSLDPTVKRLAIEVEDHPLDYATFEGVIPKGEYGAGVVLLWDLGSWVCDGKPKSSYHKGHIRFYIEGQRLEGWWHLVRTRPGEGAKTQWLLFKEADDFSRSDLDITEAFSTSVATERSFEDVKDEESELLSRESWQALSGHIPGAKKSFVPEVVKPQLATLVSEAPKGDDWLHEIKWDGYRLICIKRGSEVKILTRNSNDWTAKFVWLKETLIKVPESFVLDGELVALKHDGHPDFQRLQNSLSQNNSGHLYYYAFDLLHWRNCDLRASPLIERKELLEQIVATLDAPRVRFSDHSIGDGELLIETVCKSGLEGIISKRLNSRYFSKRTDSWLKIKCQKQQEFAIVGYTQPRKSRSHFGALILGVHKDGKFVYAGKVGSGFSQASLKNIYQKLSKRTTQQCPFSEVPIELTTSHVTWVKLGLLAEVEFSEWTEEGRLRAPSFKGLREDKNVSEVRMETPTRPPSSRQSLSRDTLEFEGLRLTHPERVLYEDIAATKLDLANYYNKIAHLMLPFIIERPLTLLRCPQGYMQGCFYQKSMDPYYPDPIQPIKVGSKGRQQAWIKDKSGLLSLVQHSALEIHPWGSKIHGLENPDILIFDLDPAPDVAWQEVVETALNLRDLLDQLQLKSFCKTTGGKGLHVVVPIRPESTWSEAKLFTRSVAFHLTKQHPGKYLINQSKEKRTGRIFIDYLRNSRGATAIAPYSTRARAGAPVATPLDWKEVKRLQGPPDFNIYTVPQRVVSLSSQPWPDFFDLNQSLPLDIKNH